MTSNPKLLTGVFAGPTIGLRYETPTETGLTNERGEFSYREGEAVGFRIGRLTLGAADGAPRMNLSQLVPRVAGRIEMLADPGITNLARLVQTLDDDGDLENGLTIAPAVHDIFSFSAVDFDRLFSPGPAEQSFAEDPQIVALLEQLNSTPGVFTANTPRVLRSGAAARNELRRNIRGILKSTDVKIPLRDGSHVFADVFRPADDDVHPVVMNFGLYGKAFDHGVIADEAGAEEKEQKEDRYFSGNPDGLQYENHETVNTAEWVPNGYVTMRVDGRGAGKSPGLQAPLGRQEAEDYYDSIEWAGTQSWSNGKVGLWGMSYYAMSQHNVASLNPPHLAAMIAQGTDADSYNEYLYGGGLFSEGFWTWWRNILTHGNSVGDRREVDWFEGLKAHPFNDPEIYGPHAVTFMTPELDKITTPVWIVGSESGVVLHQLGSSETYLHSTNAKDRKFDFVDAWFPHSYAPATVAEHMRFFDHWLKGDDNGVMNDPKVRVQLRTGNAAYAMLTGDQWPIPVELTRYYLDATPSDWTGDERGREVFRLSETVPAHEAEASYDAHLELGKPIPAPIGHVGGTPRWATGISFVGEPLEHDITFVGYLKAGLWVSSTSTDMDLHVSLRVIDEKDRELRYEAAILPMDPNHTQPASFGSLKVSHRTLDDARTTDSWPVHTHREADYAPLAPGEVVYVELGLNPSSALIRKGHRLRVDIQPISPAGMPSRSYDVGYHEGATNTIYTGPEHVSYVQLPILPA